ncbi:myoneurin-like isoform X2 [Anopheles darlingi]|uniref:myoneurin-like isoform X2 n=1 Tax=Anopheles darlingi TaxID=43151 RepID=UPI002100029F|nr:myoneurin-like isoform X2 [Anopheles darlingi]
MLTKYCRICLTSAGVVHQLDEVVHKSLTLYAILCKLYPEAFINYDEPQWPTRVCGNCKHGIMDAFRLYTICMTSFQVFKNQYEWNQLRAETSFSDPSFIIADSDAIELCTPEGNKIKIEEDDKSSLTSDEREIIDSTEERIADEDVQSSISEHQEIAEGRKDIVPPEIAETIEITNETAANYSNEIVELSIEMDCVSPKHAISSIEEHVADIEGSMEYLDDIEDSFHASIYQQSDDNQDENSVVENTVARPEISNAIMNSEYLKDVSDESEREEALPQIFSTELLNCESCRDVFIDKESYKKHIKKHSKGFHIFCKMCCEGFNSANALNVHKCKENSSTLCWICGVLLDTQEKHKRHMQDHGRKGTWACQLCPLQFSSENVLKGHVRTHKKDKGHYCDVCGARLYSKRNLSYHQRAVHGGGVEKVYSCNLCDRRFSLPYMLKTHMNTHTGHRPYSCVYCNRVYGCGGDLVEHVAKHHVGNDNIYQCHLCDADFPRIRELKSHYEEHYRNGQPFYNEILTDFGRFRFTTMDLLKMRHQKEIAQLGSDNALNQVRSRDNKGK